MDSSQNNHATTGLVEADKVSFQRVWRIKDFKQIKENDEMVNSQKFEVETNQIPNTKCTWLIGLRMGINSERPCMFVYCKLFAFNGDIETRIPATLKIVVLRPLGNTPVASYEHSSYFVKGHEIRIPVLAKVNYGYGIFGDGSLRLDIQLTLPSHTCRTQPRVKYTVEDLASRSLVAIHDNLLTLLSDEESSDLKIITRDQVELPGHKLILQMQNPIFESMLRSDLSESNTGIVKVNDVSGKTMKIILRYIYTGDLLPSWSDPDTIVEFTYAAGKYQLTEVLKVIDDTVGNMLTDEHNSCVLALLSLTNKLSLKNAEEMLLEQFRHQTAMAKTTEGLFALLAYQRENFVSTAFPIEKSINNIE